MRPCLIQAFEAAEPDTEYLITRYRDSNSNVRSQLKRIIQKAGRSPWPRLFHNLRATRQTELTGSHPAHVVAAWIGNTVRVAKNHYLQVTESDFEKAARNPAQQGVESCRTGLHLNLPENLQLLPVQPVAIACNSLLDREIAATGLEPVTRGL